MDIAEQFNIISREYDSGRRKFIPCFDDFYEKTTDFLAAFLHPPLRVLDLGAGTGLLTSFWYKHFPDSNYVLTDIAEDMLAVAKARFSGISSVEFEVSNYNNGLPKGNFDVIMSALSIHHLEPEEKELLFRSIYEKLPVGGYFVNYDQFCGETEWIGKAYDESWLAFLDTSGLSDEEIGNWKERRLLDRECSVPEEMSMIKRAGFSDVECIFTMQKFSVILAKKV